MIYDFASDRQLPPWQLRVAQCIGPIKNLLSSEAISLARRLSPDLGPGFASPSVEQSFKQTLGVIDHGLELGIRLSPEFHKQTE